MNGKLVNELKRLWLDKIDRKTAWSLILITTQISIPIGYPIWVSGVFCIVPGELINATKF